MATYTRSEYHTQLAKMSFAKSSISQLECIFILIVYVVIDHVRIVMYARSTINLTQVTISAHINCRRHAVPKSLQFPRSPSPLPFCCCFSFLAAPVPPSNYRRSLITLRSLTKKNFNFDVAPRVPACCLSFLAVPCPAIESPITDPLFRSPQQSRVEG